VPAGQFMHLVWPRMFWYVPMLHMSQVSALPIFALNFPGVQATQTRLAVADGGVAS
jgi:hypothetical protein